MKLQYERSSLLQAYKYVTETGASVYSTARMFKVPESTLRDRVNNKVHIDSKVGPNPVLSADEEATLMAHLVELASLGYGFTQKEIKCQASYYAIELGKRAAGSNPFSCQWYLSFVGRFSEKDCLKSYVPLKQISLCKTKECTVNYYNKLNEIVKEYNLGDTPENIYIMDEVDIDVPEGKKCNIVTVIGAGNAAGQKIPPYFVLVTGLTEEDHDLKRISQLITQGMKNYLENHFIKHVQRKRDNDYVIVLYDAHRMLLSVELVQWAKRNNILLFVMPPHTSHIVKESAEGVFQKVKSKYDENYGEVTPYKHLSSTTGVVALVKQIYETVVTEAALKRSFSRSGIFPLQDSKVMCDFLQKQGVLC